MKSRANIGNGGKKPEEHKSGKESKVFKNLVLGSFCPARFSSDETMGSWGKKELSKGTEDLSCVSQFLNFFVAERSFNSPNSYLLVLYQTRGMGFA